MGRMKELLDHRLEENKWDMYQLLKDVVLYRDNPLLLHLITHVAEDILIKVHRIREEGVNNESHQIQHERPDTEL